MNWSRAAFSSKNPRTFSLLKNLGFPGHPGRKTNISDVSPPRMVWSFTPLDSTTCTKGVERKN
jgi:hypothetical protein